MLQHLRRRTSLFLMLHDKLISNATASDENDKLISNATASDEKDKLISNATRQACF